jgi:hypothetical protein
MQKVPDVQLMKTALTASMLFRMMPGEVKELNTWILSDKKI